MSAINFAPPKSVQPFFTADKFVNLIVGPVGCLAGGTLVVTEFGPIPISEINRPMRVLSWNENTCRFQLSLSSVAFPKGTDFLYRVSTPQGEFDASGSHQLLCADGVYRRVEALQVESGVKTCSGDPRLTSTGSFRSMSHEGARRYHETDEGCPGGYVMSDRLDGLLALGVREGVLEPVPSHNGAQTYTRRFSLREPSLSNTLQVELSARIHSELHAYLLEIDGCPHLDAPLQIAGGGHISSGFSEYGEGSGQATAPAPLRKGLRSLWSALLKSVRGLVRASRSPSLTTSDRPILLLTRKHVKEIYWDIQVQGTHNYVTVDGAIHHNSTKTTGAIMKIAYEAKRVAPCKDGIRRTRCAVIRNTNQMLTDTTIPDFLQWFPEGDAGAYERTNKKFILKFDDVECEVLFRGLDDQNDVRRLLSLQLSFAMMDEFREIHPDIFDALTGRVGRYPSKALNGVGCCEVREDGTVVQIDKIWGATNPPDVETFWEEYISDPPKNAHITIQPSGLSPEADWLQYLKDGYYDNLCEGKSEEWIDVYVHAKFGKSLSGRPVFKSFMRDFHVSKTPLRPILNGLRPILIGVDFGLNPSAVCMQLDLRGRLMIYSALTSDGMGLTRFLDTILKPHLANKFPGAPILIIGDPAGRARVQTDEKTVYDILKAKGFKAIEASTNSPIARIAAVDEFLNRQVDGGPGFVVDPEDCQCLVRALAGRYRYKKRKDGEMDDSPEKNEASHICFAAGTRVSTPMGTVAIERLSVGDMVNTPIGPKRVTVAGVTSDCADVTEYYFSNGTALRATPEHPVLSQKGWVPIDAVQYCDILLHVSTLTRSETWKTNIQYRFLTGLGSIANSAGTIRQVMRRWAIRLSTCTAMFGSFITVPFQKGMLYTTSIRTHPIIQSLIYNCLPVTSILANTRGRTSPLGSSEPLSTLIKLAKPPQFGMDRQKGLNGTRSTEKELGKVVNCLRWFACSAAKVIQGTHRYLNVDFAPCLAKVWRAEKAESTTRIARAVFAKRFFGQISTQKQKHVLRVVGKRPCLEPTRVYGISVDSAGAYYAEGVLVSNCDALQYGCLHADAQQGGRLEGPKRRPIKVASARGWT